MNREILQRTIQIFRRGRLFCAFKTLLWPFFGLGASAPHRPARQERNPGAFLVDADQVAPQYQPPEHCPLSTVGRKEKTEVMKEKLSDISPSCQVTVSDAFVLPENLNEVFASFRKPDYIIDAIDTVSAKLALAVYAKENGLRLISSMGTGNKLHPALFKIADIYETNVTAPSAAS